LVDEVVVPLRREKVLFAELIHFAPISLRMTSVSALASGLAGDALAVVLVIVKPVEYELTIPHSKHPCLANSEARQHQW
jgi:hypothetical protein